MAAKDDLYRPVLRSVDPVPPRKPPARPNRHQALVLRNLETRADDERDWVYGRDLVAYGWVEKKAAQRGWTIYRLIDAGKAIVARHCAEPK